MNGKTKEKTCVIYASDYHFEMVTLPYIEKKIKNKNKIVVLTQDNLEETINRLIKNINLVEEKKEKLLKINWSNNDLEKFKEIKEGIDKKEKITIFIKGNKNYIKNINKNIEKWTEPYENIKTVDCYAIEEIGEEIGEIIGRYKNILGTTGEKEIEKI